MPAITEGIAVVIESRPTFSGFLNPTSKGTDKFRLIEEIENELGVNQLRVMNDLENELDATLVVRSGTSFPTPGAVLTASPGSVKWQILEVARPFTAGTSQKAEVKLKKSEGITYS